MIMVDMDKKEIRSLSDEISEEKALKIEELSNMAKAAEINIVIFSSKETMDNAIELMRLGAAVKSGLINAVIPEKPMRAN